MVETRWYLSKSPVNNPVRDIEMFKSRMIKSPSWTSKTINAWKMLKMLENANAMFYKSI